MQETSPLAARLKKQMQEEDGITRGQMQQLIDDSRQQLTDTLENDLSTIKDDTESQTQHLVWRVFKSRILWPSLTGLSLCLGICGGSWGVIQYLGSEITEKRQTLDLLGGEIAQRQETLGLLKRQGGKIQFTTCDGRMCAKIDEKANTYTGGYRILKGY